MGSNETDLMNRLISSSTESSTSWVLHRVCQSLHVSSNARLHNRNRQGKASIRRTRPTQVFHSERAQRDLGRVEFSSFARVKEKHKAREKLTVTGGCSISNWIRRADRDAMPSSGTCTNPFSSLKANNDNNRRWSSSHSKLKHNL